MAKNTEIQDLIEEIEAEFGDEVAVTGGGKGWTATLDGGVAVKSTSKAGALQGLLDILRENDEADAEADDDTDDTGEACSEECQDSTSNYCQCKCQGANHGKAGAVFVGDKPCKCGCGETTKRTFVPGHDARYHAAIALVRWAIENGVTGTEAEMRKAKAAAQRKAARERRAAKRAAQAEVAASIIAKVKGSKDLAGVN